MKRKIFIILFSLLVMNCVGGCQKKKALKDVVETEVKKQEEHKTVETAETEVAESIQKVEKETTNIEMKEEDKQVTEESNQRKETIQESAPQIPVQETPKVEEVPKEPEVSVIQKATKLDCEAIADKVMEYVNSYRNSRAEKLPGLTKYAEYRSRQLVGNFSHDTFDERAAATALQYGTYIDPTLYGMTGEPYYVAGAREAIVKAGYVGTIDDVAKSLADLVKNSASHWAYVGSSEYSYIAVGVTYESDMWYCDIAMTKENTDTIK